MKSREPVPPQATGSQKVTATRTESMTAVGQSALNAADNAPWWNRLSWEQALDRLDPGSLFSVDELQAALELPDLGNGLGGLVLGLSRAGVIRRVGYKPSQRASRSGGVVAIWAKC